MLHNIVLDGIENIHGQNGLISGIRYYNNLLYILESDNDELELLNKVRNLLHNRGIELNGQKVEARNLIDGFDFLNWHFIVGNRGEIISYSSNSDWKDCKKQD